MQTTNDTFIAKPSYGFCGIDVFLFKTLEEFESLKKGDDYVIQRYIDDTPLMDKKKWDMWIHVMLDGVYPQVAYIHRLG